MPLVKELIASRGIEVISARGAYERAFPGDCHAWKVRYCRFVARRERGKSAGTGEGAGKARGRGKAREKRGDGGRRGKSALMRAAAGARRCVSLPSDPPLEQRIATR